MSFDFEKFAQYEVKKDSKQKPVVIDTLKNDISSYEVPEPLSARQDQNIKGPVYNRDTYQFPYRDSIADFGRQVPLGVAQGLQSVLDNGLNLNKIGDKLGISNKGVKEAEQQLNEQYKDYSLAPRIKANPSGSIPESLLNSYGYQTSPTTKSGRIGRQGGTRLGESLPFVAGGPISNVVSSFIGGAAGQGVREAGGPEWAATATDLGIGLNPINLYKTGKDLIRSPTTKPSGITDRRFELLNKEKQVTPRELQNIVKTVEEDFGRISNDLFQQSQTVRNVENIPGYIEQVNQNFGKLEQLADQLPGTISRDSLVGSIQSTRKVSPRKGVVRDELEKAYDAAMNQLINDLPPGEYTPRQLLDQYRKNNKRYGDIAEKNLSVEANQGKLQAQRDFNLAIAESFDQNYPGSQFSEPFQYMNKINTEIESYKAIKDTVNSAFTKNGINYQVFEKSLSDPIFQRQVNAVLGPDGAKQFKGLLNDMVSQKDAYSLLRTSGIPEGQIDPALDLLIKTYVISPKTSKFITAMSYARKAFSRGLSNPVYFNDWKRGIELFKNGNVNQAIPIFERLSREDQNAPQNTIGLP